MNSFSQQALERLIRKALEEDIGPGDITTSSVLTGAERGTARAVAKAELIVAGIDVFKAVFLFLDQGLIFDGQVEDRTAAGSGECLAEVSGSLSSILKAERVALNLFQRMCGIATMTGLYVEAVSGTRARILDTRKTPPGLRFLDKYAVRVGGGSNHRFGLYDGVLVKDNHIEAAGGIGPAVVKVRKQVPHTAKIEVEVGNFKELKEALDAGADVVMLDNMGFAAMKKAVRFVAGRIPLEASGNVTLDNVKLIADTGVDFISVGALTHSVKAADISLKIGR